MPLIDLSNNRLYDCFQKLKELLQKHAELVLNISGNPVASTDLKSALKEVDKAVLVRLIFIPELHTRMAVFSMFFEEAETAAEIFAVHKDYYDNVLRISALKQAREELE
jgi:hypothetical protein